MYEQIMGSAWRQLPASIRSAHVIGESRGFMHVRWGDGLLARGVARALGFPRPAAQLAVLLRVQPVVGGLRWVRHMGTAIVASTQVFSEQLLLESFGPFVCAFRLQAEPLGLRYSQEYAALRCGRFRLRLPRWAAPRVAALVSHTSEGALTQVEIAAPWIGRVLRYEGIMRPAHPEPRP